MVNIDKNVDFWKTSNNWEIFGPRETEITSNKRNFE